MDLEMNLVNLVDALQKVTEVDNLGLHLGVPKHQLDKIRQDIRTTDERMVAMLTWWLDNDLHCTWEKVIAALKAINKHVLADAVAKVSQHQSLSVLYEMDSQRWKKKVDNFGEMLQEFQQRSEHLESEWEKGETEWREYLKKLLKIEKDWEEIVRAQKAERAYLTLGITRLFEGDSESLHRYAVLEDKMKHQVKRSQELREFYERTIQHQCGLQDTETELKAWGKELCGQALDLEKRIEQLEELGEKFSGEVRNCKNRLEKSQERLQICRKMMSECREELTKSQRQLVKCRQKLTECEVSLTRCRDELSGNHSQITNCIEKLKENSKSLSHQIAGLTVAAGGVVGGTGGLSMGVGIGTLLGGVLGPPGIAAGAAIGAAVGVGTGVIGGGVTAYFRHNQLEKAKAELQTCESELQDCGNVVERCKEVLRKSQEELIELKKIVSKLEHTFNRL